VELNPVMDCIRSVTASEYVILEGWIEAMETGAVLRFLHFTLHLHFTFSFFSLTYLISLIPGHESFIYDSFYLSLTRVLSALTHLVIYRYDSFSL
jgi:hypothetical protein